MLLPGKMKLKHISVSIEWIGLVVTPEVANTDRNISIPAPIQSSGKELARETPCRVALDIIISLSNKFLIKKILTDSRLFYLGLMLTKPSPFISPFEGLWIG